MGKPEIPRAEFVAASVATLAWALFAAAAIVSPYPSAGVCLAVAALAVVVGLLAGVAYLLLRWKRGAL